MTVFDFDKTLINKDTLFGFYKIIAENDSLFLVKRFILRIASLFYKLGVLSNNDLKKLGIRLFLVGKSFNEVQEAGKKYAKSLSLNDVYYQYYKTIDSSEKLVISASFEEYLIYVFPCNKIIGSVLAYKNGLVSGLGRNMYGINKRIALKEIGILHIQQFFTDSYADRPLMDIAEKVYLVENNNISVIKEL